MAFEQSSFIGGLSKKSYQRMSNKLYRRVVQQILSKDCPTDLFSEGWPIDFDIEDYLMSFQKQKSFVLKTVFHTWHSHV